MPFACAGWRRFVLRSVEADAAAGARVNAAGETLQDFAARLECKDGTIKHVLINSNALFRDGKFAKYLVMPGVSPTAKDRSTSG